MSFSAVFSQNILVRWLTGRSGAPDLAVTMSGIRLGERLLQIGLADGRLLVALAAKIGMSGRTCGIDTEAAAVSRAEAAAAREGVLVEVHQAAVGGLPFDAGDFDAVVVNTPEVTVELFREALRVLRAGGRCVVIMKPGRQRISGNATSGTSHAAESPADVVEVMRGSGFKAARLLAERDGFAFAEGVKSAA